MPFFRGYNTLYYEVPAIASVPGNLLLGTAVKLDSLPSGSDVPSLYFNVSSAGPTDNILGVVSSRLNPAGTITNLIPGRVILPNAGQFAVLLSAAGNKGDYIKVKTADGRWGPITGGEFPEARLLENGGNGALAWAYPLVDLDAAKQIIQIAQGAVVADQSTPSGTLSDLAGASVTIATQSGTRVEVEASFSTSNSSLLGAQTTMVFDLDGAVRRGSGQSNPALATNTQTGAIVDTITGLTAANHTFKLRWATTGGTARCRPVTAPNTEHAVIKVREIRV